jgi:hypothetical protein
MTWQTGLKIGAIVLFGALQYGLVAYALQDLRHRARVRGENKVLWGLVVLCVPIAGALAYAVYGPTSFRDRPPPPPADPNRRRGLPADLPGWRGDQPESSGAAPRPSPPTPGRGSTGRGDS